MTRWAVFRVECPLSEWCRWSRSAAHTGDTPRIGPVSTVRPGPDHTFAFPFHIAGTGSAAQAPAAFYNFGCDARRDPGRRPFEPVRAIEGVAAGRSGRTDLCRTSHLPFSLGLRG